MLEFHRHEMQTLALLRKKKVEARLGMIIMCAVGIMLGCIWADTRNRAEMDRVQRACVAEEAS
jgi:hypothetical protein